IDRCFSADNLEKEIADTNTLFVIVDYRDVPVGFIKINIDSVFENYKKEETLELERIYLTKAACGKGIGALLLHFTFEFAKQKNKKLIWLKVMDSSTAPINFYKKNGFEICGTTNLDFEQMKKEFR